MDIALSAAGGLAMFILAMSMMTDGLKVSAGGRLRSLLQNWTSNPIRGVLSGALVTAIVQSSSAVTVATIGFANAGILSLGQALGVIFGANVGTTMTGWLVSLVGFGFKVETFALPLLALGVAIRYLAPEKRIQGLGSALAGFGLFFLGLAILQDAFSGIAASVGIEVFGGASGIAAILTLVAIGFAATVLTQSSSAAIAIILTAASESVISTSAAAAAIIGANVGTTSTALIAVVGATANAKRVALGHLAFNLLTGLVALAILPAFLAFISFFTDWAGMGDNPVPLLAMFHTLFNVLGVILLLPFVGALARGLGRLYRTKEEDLAAPRYLDKTVLATPMLAVTALHSELRRLSQLVREMVLSALWDDSRDLKRTGRQLDAVHSLVEAINDFDTSVRMENLPRDVSEELPVILRTSRYLEEAARIAAIDDTVRRLAVRIADQSTRASLSQFTDAAGESVKLGQTGHDASAESDEAMQCEMNLQRAYQEAKSALLWAAANRRMPIEQVELVLDALSRTRRMVEQMFKADCMPAYTIDRAPASSEVRSVS